MAVSFNIGTDCQAAGNSSSCEGGARHFRRRMAMAGQAVRAGVRARWQQNGGQVGRERLKTISRRRGELHESPFSEAFYESGASITHYCPVKADLKIKYANFRGNTKA